MKAQKIEMIGGPFKGNCYYLYSGERKTISTPAVCVDIELIPGDYYMGIPSIGALGCRAGTMSAQFLQDNPALWQPIS